MATGILRETIHLLTTREGITMQPSDARGNQIGTALG
jgi:hypothetical protein